MHRAISVLAASVLLSPHAWCALTVILTRHAEVVQAGSDPALSSQGRLRAELLAAMLRDTHLEAIFVTEFVRTQQTAQPSADLFHLQPQRIDEGNAAALVDSIRRVSGTVLVVGHSNTVPEVISMLGGPTVQIRETEFDHLFIVTVAPERTSVLHLRYGEGLPRPSEARDGVILNNRSPVMQISFVRSGGFPGALRNVKATINLKDDAPEVSSDAAYRRDLAADEAEQLRTGADPADLAKAARTIAARTSRSADLDHYHITVTTKDGKTHDVDFNTSGSSKELQDIPPAVVKLLRWLQEESQKILAHRVKGG